MKRLTYESIPELSREEVEAAIVRDVPGELLIAVLSAALYAADPEWAEDVCVRLASHHHFNVRGNAILGFGHLARIHGRLDHGVVFPIIEAALTDADEYVRGHAHAAAEDVEMFLGWAIRRPEMKS